MDSKLNIMYTSEEITEITGGRFSPSDPPVQAEYLDVATEVINITLDSSCRVIILNYKII